MIILTKYPQVLESFDSLALIRARENCILASEGVDKEDGMDCLLKPHPSNILLEFNLRLGETHTFQLVRVFSHPWMRKNILCRRAFGRISHKKRTNHILGPHRNPSPILWIKLKLANLGQQTQLSRTVGIERRIPSQQNEHNHTHRPHVHLRSILFPSQNLRRDISRSSTHGFQRMIPIGSLLGKSKVGNLNLRVAILIL
mmetsp:Transcript_41827/g.76446  ORF Transcript_41827/g.76446 Transcript_41827/m.76446 type:complete len:200 (-) Transcript_41827:1438-2037(-)